jgi:hypothetical protein
MTMASNRWPQSKIPRPKAPGSQPYESTRAFKKGLPHIDATRMAEIMAGAAERRKKLRGGK